VDIPILITAPTTPYIVDALDRAFHLYKLWNSEYVESELAEILPRIRGIALGGHTNVDHTFLQQFPNREIISSFGVGMTT
jgi:lactate dehydrogenase-like 2-hydroxyacid dehydrogenase